MSHRRANLGRHGECRGATRGGREETVRCGRTGTGPRRRSRQRRAAATHVVRPRELRHRPNPEGVIWHRPTFLPPHHLAVVNGLVVTTPARTLADLGNLGTMHPMRMSRAIESAWSAGLVTRRHLEVMADEWCERGRRGSAFLHEYLESRPVDWIPPASNLAGRFIRLIVEAGLPEPRSEVNVGVDRWLGRVDCLDPELPLIAEIDSDRYHVAPIDADADAQRDQDMREAGFTVVRFREFDVWHRPHDVVERWRSARRSVLRSAS